MRQLYLKSKFYFMIKWYFSNAGETTLDKILAQY